MLFKCYPIRFTEGVRIMKFVSVRDIRLKPGEVWKLSKKEKELIITSNGRPVAILIGTNEDSFEEELETIQRARALRALDAIHRKSILKGTARISNKEIDKEISAVRKGRRL